MKESLFLLLLTTAQASVAWVCPLLGQTPTPDYGESYIARVDPLGLDDAALYDVLLRLSTREPTAEGWRRIRVRIEEGIPSLVEREFGLGRRFPKARTYVTKLIASSNRLLLTEKLRPGDSLELPPLPRLPRSTARISLTQFISWSSGLVSVARADQALSFPLDVAAVPAPLSEAATWTVYGTRSEIQSFLQLARDINERLIKKPILITQVATLNPDTAATTTTVRPDSVGATDTWVAPAVPLPTIAYAVGLKYQLLDNFTGAVGDSCDHGRKVLDVIRLTFDSLHLNSQLVSGAVSILNLNYRVHLDSALDWMREYAATYSPRGEEALKKDIDRIAATPPSPSTRLPYEALYLRTLYWKAMEDTATAVISMSEAFEVTGSEVLPEAFGVDSSVLLLNAASNENRAIEETRKEPIRTIIRLGSKSGAAIVAGSVKDGRVYGMYSSSGKALALIGRATGWGGPGTCIVPSDTGNSFATPQVAALAFAAFAHLRANGIRLRPDELRRRLAISSRVAAAYVNKVAAAGVPQLALLLQGDGGHLVKPSGEVAHVVVDETESFLTVVTPSGPRRLRLGRQRGGGDVPAFYIHGFQVFYYDEPEEVWKSATYTKLQLAITWDDLPEMYDAERFRAQFAGLVIF